MSKDERNLKAAFLLWSLGSCQPPSWEMRENWNIGINGTFKPRWSSCYQSFLSFLPVFHLISLSLPSTPNLRSIIIGKNILPKLKKQNKHNELIHLKKDFLSYLPWEAAELPSIIWNPLLRGDQALLELVWRWGAYYSESCSSHCWMCRKNPPRADWLVLILPPGQWEKARSLALYFLK